MGKYIALLRGVNVGGKNKLSMTELKKEFEENGFENVIVYINSGNIIFCNNTEENELELKRKCELIIKDKFKLNIIVSIISAKDLSDSLANAPIWWDLDKNSKHNLVLIY